MKTAKNLRSEAHVELKDANRAFNECLANIFMPKWIAGEKLQLTEVCQESYERMQSADEAVYGERPMNIKPVTLPEAQLWVDKSSEFRNELLSYIVIEVQKSHFTRCLWWTRAQDT